MLDDRPGPGCGGRIPAPSPGRTTGSSRASTGASARANATGSGSTATACVPIRRRARSRRARTARPTVVDPGHVRVDRRRRGGGIARDRPGRSTRCTSARSRRRGRGAAAAAQLADARAPRHHGRRDDAGRRFAGRVRLGLRRRRISTRRRDSTARPTISARSSIARTRVGLGVILDVVYNHLGPDGNYLSDFSPRLLHRQVHERLGRGAQLRGTGAGARVLRRERRLLDRRVPLDGLRLDATQDINDASPEHVIASIVRRARAPPPDGASIYIVAENEPQDTRLRAAAGARAATASTRCGTTTSTTRAVVALTGRREAYYTDYRGSPQEFVSAREVRLPLSGAVVRVAEASARGTPALDLAGAAFVSFLENHDQVANCAVRQAPASADRRPGATAR